MFKKRTCMGGSLLFGTIYGVKQRENSMVWRCIADSISVLDRCPVKMRQDIAIVNRT